MDTLTPEQRSEVMSKIRSKDTKPEMVVRRHLHALGFRIPQCGSSKIKKVINCGISGISAEIVIEEATE